MDLNLTEEEIQDMRQAFIIAIHAEDNNERTKKFFDRIEATMDKLDQAQGLYNPNKVFEKNIVEKKPFSVMVSGMLLAGFLDKNLNKGNMVTVFDIVEHNPDGASRLRRLIEENCTINLTPEQIEDAIELLNDYDCL